jgi:hypothetical protein
MRDLLVWASLGLIVVQASLAIWFRFFGDDPLLAIWHLLLAVFVAVAMPRGA